MRGVRVAVAAATQPGSEPGLKPWGPTGAKLSAEDLWSRQSTAVSERECELCPLKVVFESGRTALVRDDAGVAADDPTCSLTLEPRPAAAAALGLVDTPEPPEVCLPLPPGLPPPGAEDDAALQPTSKPLPKDYRHRQVPRRLDFEGYSKQRQMMGEDSLPTTLMIRNIPNRYSQIELMAELEDLGYAGTFNFFYLPIDPGRRRRKSGDASKSSGSNVGYAFVNFVNPLWAAKCMVELQGYGFKLHRKVSTKVASVSVAHLQGLEANRTHYANSSVRVAMAAGAVPWESTPLWEEPALADDIGAAYFPWLHSATVATPNLWGESLGPFAPR